MDELDIKILDILESNSREAFTEIAEKLNVSDATVHIRVKRLVDEGVIKKFTVALDYQKLGYPVTAFIEIKLGPGSIDRVMDILKRLNGVVDIYELHSHCDVLIKVKATDLNSLRNTVVEGIRGTLTEELISDDVYTVLRVVREDETLRKDRVDVD